MTSIQDTIIYDFSQYKTKDDWINYAKSINTNNASANGTNINILSNAGETSNFDSLAGGYIYRAWGADRDGVGYLELILPNTHQYFTINIKKANEFSKVFIKLNNNVLNTITTATGSLVISHRYEQINSILRIEEDWTAIVSNIIITISQPILRVNCVGNWSNWGACNATCINNNSSASGNRTRTFTITTPSANGGTNCTIVNNTVGSETCIKDCSVNCVGSWSNWGSCNATCINNNSSASGSRTRTFTITTPSANGGIACTIANNTVGSETCTKDCSVNCIGSWGDWRSCSTCNDINNNLQGSKTRTFTITTPSANGGIACTIANNTIVSETCYCKIDTIFTIQDSSYFIRENKTVLGTGHNMGNQITTDHINDVLLPIKISYNNIIQIGPIGYVLKDDGTVVFNERSSRYINLNVNLDAIWTVTQIPVTTNIIQMSTNTGHLLFLKGDGTVFSLGANRWGQLGIGNNVSQDTLQQVKGLNGSGYITNIKQIAAGWFHSLFLNNDGIVFGCGRNIEGQLGIGHNNDRFTLQQVIGATNIKQIAAGVGYSLFLKKDGTVWGCGYNYFGQLGIGNNVSQNTLQQVKGLNGSGYITNIKQIAAGDSYSLFLKNDDTVLGCGRNIEGQLGIGIFDVSKNTLQQVIGATNIKQISTGNRHSIFLKNDGTVCGCGYNEYGQLGIGNNENKNTLQQII
jgi:hypothetical protein